MSLTYTHKLLLKLCNAFSTISSSLTNAYFDEAGTLVLCCEYEGSELQFTISGITATSTISNTAYEGEEYYW